MILYDPQTSNNKIVDALLQEWDKALVLLKKMLQQTKHRMKQMGDKNFKYVTFEIGYLVLIKLQTYIQTSLTQQPFYKINQKSYGLYKVLKMVGQAAYNVDLPLKHRFI